MTEQPYSGTCPSTDPDGFRIDVKISYPGPVKYEPTLTINCPIEAFFSGEPCLDGGIHVLHAITMREYEDEFGDIEGGT